MNKMPLDVYRGVAQRAEQLVSPEQVAATCDAMAARLTALLGDKDPVVLCVMTGGIVPVGLLLPRLNFALRLDYAHATRYRGATQGGALEWLHRPTAIRGEHVLIIDDIFDEGITLDSLVTACHEDGAASVTTAVLVEKERTRSVAYRPDVVGCLVPDRYVMGCGLDYKSYFRNASGIYAAASEDV